jgi:hypothetical protein
VADPLAVYGAVIGTTAAAGALWNIYHGWWRDRARLTLTIGHGGGPVIGWPPMGKTSVNLAENVYVTAINRGRRPVQVSSAGLVNDDRTTVPFMADSLGQAVFPKVLDERNPSVDAAMPTAILREYYSRPSAPRPTHIFYYSAGRRHQRRLGDGWVQFLIWSPAQEGPSHARAGSGPGSEVEDGAGS